MKILINASNLVMGGALQVARSLLIEIPKLGGEHSIKAAVSPQLAQILPENYDLIVVDPSPARIFAGMSSRRQLGAIEDDFSPDVVLSIFGPTYWKPRNKHVCGFAEPWMYTINDFALSTLNGFQKFKVKIKTIFKKWVLKNENPTAFVFETDDMAKAVNRYITNSKTYVVYNNCSQVFYNKSNFNQDNNNAVLPKKQPNEFRIVTLTQYYPHKNLEIIPEVAAILKTKRLPNVKFYLPFDRTSRGWQRISKIAKDMKVQDSLKYVGPVSPAVAPQFYSDADIMFLPSVLECFSANYPEAMMEGVPIVTTKMPFAESICKEAAKYFTPMDPLSAAEKILQLYRNAELRRELIENGYKRVKQFPTPKEKAQAYLKICTEIVQF